MGKTPAEAFDTKLTACSLRRYEPSGPDAPLLTAHAKLAKSAAAQYQQGWMGIPEIHFFYVDQPGVNAFAMEDPENDFLFVGMFRESPIIIHKMFGVLMAHAAVLPMIGASDRESHEPQCAPRYKLPLEPRDAINGFEFARDPVRRQFGARMATLAVEFIWLHEAGHLLHGHLPVLSGDGSLLVHFEMATTAGGPQVLSNEEQQSLEMDADSEAANRVFRAVIRTFEQGGRPNELYGSTIEATLYNYAFSICALYLLFSREQSFHLIDQIAHAPPGIRLGQILSTLFEALRIEYGLDRSLRISIVVKRAVFDVLKAFGAVTGMPPKGDEGFFENFQSQVHGQYLRSILDAYSRLYPELLRWTRIKLAPPQHEHGRYPDVPIGVGGTVPEFTASRSFDRLVNLASRLNTSVAAEPFAGRSYSTPGAFDLEPWHIVIHTGHRDERAAVRLAVELGRMCRSLLKKGNSQSRALLNEPQATWSAKSAPVRRSMLHEERSGWRIARRLLQKERFRNWGLFERLRRRRVRCLARALAVK